MSRVRLLTRDNKTHNKSEKQSKVREGSPAVRYQKSMVGDL